MKVAKKVVRAAWNVEGIGIDSENEVFFLVFDGGVGLKSFEKDILF